MKQWIILTYDIERANTLDIEMVFQIYMYKIDLYVTSTYVNVKMYSAVVKYVK